MESQKLQIPSALLPREFFDSAIYRVTPNGSVSSVHVIHLRHLTVVARLVTTPHQVEVQGTPELPIERPVELSLFVNLVIQEGQSIQVQQITARLVLVNLPILVFDS